MKRPAAWGATDVVQKASKVQIVSTASRVPLQDYPQNGSQPGTTNAAQENDNQQGNKPMGPPPPRKPATEEGTQQTQVLRRSNSYHNTEPVLGIESVVKCDIKRLSSLQRSKF